MHHLRHILRYPLPRTPLLLTSVLLIALLFSTGCVVQSTSIPDLAQMSEEEQAELETTAASNGLTVEQALTLAKLEDRGPTPELTNDIWFNSEPLRLADLRGNVVIVEFWTYG